jgi:hypothetical protein
VKKMVLSCGIIVMTLMPMSIKCSKFALGDSLKDQQ